MCRVWVDVKARACNAIHFIQFWMFVIIHISIIFIRNKGPVNFRNDYKAKNNMDVGPVKYFKYFLTKYDQIHHYPLQDMTYLQWTDIVPVHLHLIY